MQSFLESISTGIDRLNRSIGEHVAWLCFLMVIITFGIVVARYVFNTGSILMQELVLYLFAFVFMLGGAYTYLNDGHVRVDIFFKRRTAKQQAWINIFGNLFLLIPTMLAILILSWPYVMFSWSLLEGSKENAGLDLVYILKTSIPVFAILMTLQSVSQIIKQFKILQSQDHQGTN